MARPNSRKTLMPQKVSTPPTSQSMMLTPTEPVEAKTPEGVEKTAIQYKLLVPFHILYPR